MRFEGVFGRKGLLWTFGFSTEQRLMGADVGVVAADEFWTGGFKGEEGELREFGSRAVG